MTTQKKKRYINSLTNISTLDGRESTFISSLQAYLSEGALHRYRAVVEIEALIALSESNFSAKPTITNKEKQKLRQLTRPEQFDASIPAEYDHFGRKGIGPVEHDVKAVELSLREKFSSIGLSRLNEWVHFPMTSEDTNNIAWNLMLRDAINNVWLPVFLSVTNKLSIFSVKYASVPVVGITHGMKASPTTIGKRFSYILEQFLDVMETMSKLQLTGKFSGAVGNYNAITAVAPDFNFEAFARDFVERFGFDFVENANQRNSHVAIVRLFHEMKLANTIGIDLCENIRHSVMMGWLYQKGTASHVGSSVMPHKINPWFFEVSQGYYEQANQLINGSAEGLIQSVFERDLTDHPWERAYGEIIGKSLISLSYIDNGLNTLHVDEKKALQDLQTTPEVLSEAIQIAGRIAGVSNIYMTIKKLTKGKDIDTKTLQHIIDEYIPDKTLKKRLKALKPETYTGKASQIAKRTATKSKLLQERLQNGILNSSKSIVAVLFDFDNTLQVGDKDEVIARLTEISKRLDLGFKYKEIVMFADRSDYREMRQLMVAASKKPVTEDQFQVENLAVSGMFDDKLHLADGTQELLSVLKAADKKIGLVTTRGSNSLSRVLKKYDILRYFDVIINRDDTIRRKPHPEPIALALEKLGITDTRNVLYVGDKQEDDVIAGNALGLKTILVNTDPLDKYGARPTYHFSSLKPIIKFFDHTSLW